MFEYVVVRWSTCSRNNVNTEGDCMEKARRMTFCTQVVCLTGGLKNTGGPFSKVLMPEAFLRSPEAADEVRIKG